MSAVQPAQHKACNGDGSVQHLLTTYHWYYHGKHWSRCITVNTGPGADAATATTTTDIATAPARMTTASAATTTDFAKDKFDDVHVLTCS